MVIYTDISGNPVDPTALAPAPGETGHGGLQRLACLIEHNGPMLINACPAAPGYSTGPVTGEWVPLRILSEMIQLPPEAFADSSTWQELLPAWICDGLAKIDLECSAVGSAVLPGTVMLAAGYCLQPAPAIRLYLRADRVCRPGEASPQPD